MTLRCGGGTSSARSQYSRFLYMAPAQIGAALNNIPTVWAVAFAGAIGSITYDLSTFCTTDPPADPGMTASDWAALLNPFTLSDAVLARSKFRDFLGHYLWDTFCKCDSGIDPTPFTPPSPPPDLPQVNDPSVFPTYPTGAPCGVFSYSRSLTPPNTSTPADVITSIPSGSKSVTLTVIPSRHMVSADTTGWQVNLNTFNASGTFVSNPVHVEESSTGSSLTMTAALPATATQFRAFVSVFHVNSPVELEIDVNFYCDNVSGGGGVPQPCPPDTFTQLQLDQILQLVTLIQRQAAPFAYVFGTSHSGLSGEGHIDVQGLLGVKVQLDAWGSGVGVESGDPDEFYEAGWITWSNADGATKREWITHSPFVSLPALAGQFTRVGYTLGQGVSATITEFVREP